jgi:VIT1/CCC1 family predicted Fe2+/Mn2+ transporter
MNSSNNQSVDIKKPSPLSEYFKEVIYGGIDGIVTTFAVVAGFVGAAASNDSALQLTFVVVLLFGLANLFADAASMGLGNFLSVRSEKDLYNSARVAEEKRLQNNPEAETALAVTMLQEKGFSPEDSSTLANIYKKNQEYLLDFIMNNKLEMSDPRGTNPALTGTATFISFMFFGVIPLLPFILIPSGSISTVFTLSVLGTFLALVSLGLLKWRVVGGSILSALIEVVTVGGVAALIAYYVGTFFAG